MIRRSLLIICWLIAVPGWLCSLLIILPAPSYHLWMAAVAASEWSVWLLLAGLFSAMCGGVALLIDRRSVKALIVPLMLGLMMMICACVPVIEAHRMAARAGLSLSWKRYLFAAERDAAPILIDEQHDLEFASPNGQPLRLDVYRPRAAVEQRAIDSSRPPLPAIIVIHGGSWRAGSKSDFARYDRWLAEGGRVVFDINYRLANSEARFPAQLMDVKCAIGWVKSHAAEFHVDPERLALLGRSAGGQLALLAAYTQNDRTSQDGSSSSSCAAQDTRVRAVISFYGPTDLAWDYTHPGRPDVIDTPGVLENFLGGSPSNAPQAYAAASPIEHVSSQSPPTLFLHGGHDQLVLAENVERIIPRLAAAGVPYKYVYLPWANHGFDYNFNGWSSQLAQAEISKFLDAYL